jgi:hypothetical protein
MQDFTLAYVNHANIGFAENDTVLLKNERIP